MFAANARLILGLTAIAAGAKEISQQLSRRDWVAEPEVGEVGKDRRERREFKPWWPAHSPLVRLRQAESLPTAHVATALSRRNLFFGGCVSPSLGTSDLRRHGFDLTCNNAAATDRLFISLDSEISVRSPPMTSLPTALRPERTLKSHTRWNPADALAGLARVRPRSMSC